VEQDQAYYESLKADQEKAWIKQVKPLKHLYCSRLHRKRKINERMNSC